MKKTVQGVRNVFHVSTKRPRRSVRVITHRVHLLQAQEPDDVRDDSSYVQDVRNRNKRGSDLVSPETQGSHSG